VEIRIVDENHYLTLTDRIKDVIKSGGDWISSVELELLIASHPGVAEASGIGVHDDRWQERPLAVVGTKATKFMAEQQREFLNAKVTKWWLYLYGARSRTRCRRHLWRV
jgi:fatty-acyl-CoA synthase